MEPKRTACRCHRPGHGNYRYEECCTCRATLARGMDFVRSLLSRDDPPAPPPAVAAGLNANSFRVTIEDLTYTCDGCHRPMPDTDKRYHCWFCGDFDLYATRPATS